MRKMKTEAPEQLQQLISKYIVNADKPVTVPPKATRYLDPEAAIQLLFSKQDLELMLSMARAAGNKEIIRKLTPRKDLRSVKELISSIRHGKVEQELWHCYVEAIGTQQQATANASAANAMATV